MDGPHIEFTFPFHRRRASADGWWERDGGGEETPSTQQRRWPQGHPALRRPPPPLPDDFARRIGRARSGISVDRRGGGPRRDRPVGVGGRTAARAAASGCAASASGGPPPARVGADQQTPALARSAADAGQRGPKKNFLATVATPCCDRQPMPVAPPQRPNVRLASVGRVSPPRIVYMMYVPSSLSGGLEEGDSLPRVPTENPFADPRTVAAARETTPSYLRSVPRRAPRRDERPLWTEPPSRLLFGR